MTVFLTPDGEPFFGGTYFPPEPRHGLPSVPRRCCRRWRTPTASSATPSREQAAALVEALAARARRSRRRASRSSTRSSPRRSRSLRAQFDPRWGGFGQRAEVPARVDARVPPAPRRARAGRRRRSTAMAAGGMYDLVGGGFHRYSVDAALARAALREDALRQRPARPRVPARVARAGNDAYRASSRRRSTTACASCGSTAAASPRRRTPTPTASRG